MANNIISLYPQSGKDSLSHSGNNFIKSVGEETIKDAIYATLCGENLRDSTEGLTRKRLILSNGSLLMLFLNGCNAQQDFLQELTKKSVEQIKSSHNSQDRWILQWLVGLTDKQIQNVLRDNPAQLDKYRTELDEHVGESLQTLSKDFGDLKGKISIADKSVEVDWKFFSYLFTAIGSQTLTIRGSDKSMYGKLFGNLILGTILTALGFEQVDINNPKKFEKVFWLSERQNKRESDATLIYKPGKGVRFDIGFIGRGNPEISLDKVSRFEREIEFGRSNHFLATFIIVDKVGEKSRVYEMAKQIDGTVIQMSMSYWPRELAIKLKERLGFQHEIVSMNDRQINKFIIESVRKIDISRFVK